MSLGRDDRTVALHVSLTRHAWQYNACFLPSTGLSTPVQKRRQHTMEVVGALFAVDGEAACGIDA